MSDIEIFIGGYFAALQGYVDAENDDLEGVVGANQALDRARTQLRVYLIRMGYDTGEAIKAVGDLGAAFMDYIRESDAFPPGLWERRRDMMIMSVRGFVAKECNALA